MIYVGFKTFLALNIISQLKKKTVMENFDDGGCHNNYSQNFEKLLNFDSFSQSLGYSKIDSFYNTQYIISDKPLPIDPDFFYLLTNK
jgi:hypothetical protein